MSNQYRNILVHSLVNIGDVLLSTSAVALLRQVYPDAKITMMVRPAAAQLVTNNPVIDEVIIYDYKAKHKSFGKMWQMAQRLRSKHFDLSISFDRKLRPALLTWLAGIPVRVGPDKVFDDKPSRVTMLYTRTIPIHHDIVNTLQAETYQAIIRGFTGAIGSAKPVMARIMPENEEKARQLLVSLKPGQSDSVIARNEGTKQSQPTLQQSRPLRIALCVKGTFPLKTWPKERFAAVVDQLAAQYTAQFFIIGALEDKDYADEVIVLAKTPIANFCGQTSLVDLAALLQKTDLLVTVDTGTAHIAATVGILMVVIYGCTTPNRWHPLNKNAVILSSHEPCCPCSIAAAQCPQHTCMYKIDVQKVVEKIRQMAL
ncbi:MAG: lipopolysaccharide heptosyltransferase II [Veillonellales bacterium]